MKYEEFNRIVTEHRNSIIIIGIIVLVMCLVAIIIVEFYVRRHLDCKFFTIRSIKFSPTLLMIIPLIAIVIYFPIEINKCNVDLNQELYTEYVGQIEYSSSSVKFKDENFTVFVGKGFELIPRGENYGRCIYSSNSKVIVYWEKLSE